MSLSRTSPFFTVPYTLCPVVYLPARLKPTARTPSPASSSLLGPSLFVALRSIPCVLSLILPRYRPTARTPPPTPPSLCLGMYCQSSKQVPGLSKSISLHSFKGCVRQTRTLQAGRQAERIQHVNERRITALQGTFIFQYSLLLVAMVSISLICTGPGCCGSHV